MKLTLFFALINAANAARLSQDSTTDASNEPETPSVPDVPTYDPEDVPAELQPVDDTEGQIIMSLVEGCPDQVQAMRQCYNEDDATLMSCTNCAWQKLMATQEGEEEQECAAQIEAWLEAGTADCADCAEECSDKVKGVYTCGIPKICGDETPDAAVEIA